MMETIESLQQFEQILADNESVLAYFSTESCSVCKVVKPKVSERISERFPRVKMVYIQSDKLPELAAQNRVFTAPVVVVFFAGKETIRKSRAFGVDELGAEIQRPYSMFFE